MANQTLEQRAQRPKHPYVVALPNLEGGQYINLRKTGTTFASSDAEAVGNYLFRKLPRQIARVTMDKIKDKLGGYGKFALRIDSRELREMPINQVIEIASFLSGVYKDRDTRNYEREAERLLEEIKKYREQ